MNKIIIFLVISVILTSCQTQKQSLNIVTSDIKNFWEAYDKITLTQDSILQNKYLDSLYLKKGTDGLKAIRQVRNYTPQEYIFAINNYPKFWTSIRENTLKAGQYSSNLEKGIKKLKDIYPNIKPTKVYFTIGALRTSGTTLDSLVLIGSELALADKDTPTNEFPENLSHLRDYFDSEPSKNIVFLNIHEYVHTQQKTTTGNSLLAQTVLEGVAEFVAEKALEIKSPNPQIEFGRKSDTKIKAKFELEMFSPNLYNWIWNSSDNEFGMRDLAYYVGYKICEDYYNISTDKPQAIKEMIELDYNDESELIKFVEKSEYFDKPLNLYKEAFEKSRPKVESIDKIQNKSTSVQTDIDVLTIHFSQKMDTRFRNFQLGPLGEKNIIRIKDFQGFSEDGKSVSFGIEKLEP
ncbi:gliding motility protein GldB-related protein, partial [Riemerella anatipestifer]